MLPSQDDIDGSLYGIARLHSLYGLDTDKFADDGIIKTVFNHKEITSLPSVMTLSSKLSLCELITKISYNCY